MRRRGQRPAPFRPTPTAGQCACTQAANAIRFAALGFVMHPVEWMHAMTGLADLIEQYDGLGKCALCGGNTAGRSHHDTCPLRLRTEERKKN